MSDCNHRWRDGPDVTERIYCTKCGLTTVPSLDIKRIEELKEKLHQRGQVIAAHISIDDLQTSWDRIIVAECIREQGDDH